MAVYPSGHFAAANSALAAAAVAGKDDLQIAGTLAFYRAVSSFREGKQDEASTAPLILTHLDCSAIGVDNARSRMAGNNGPSHA
jgi:hypothetical protein